jgi:hypothetical protein
MGVIGEGAEAAPPDDVASGNAEKVAPGRKCNPGDDPAGALAGVLTAEAVSVDCDVNWPSDVLILT